MITLVHLSDPHFGRDVDLEQIRALQVGIPKLEPTAVVISGDLTQRARHGEFQRALSFVEELRATAPVFVVPGNHDVQWWESPFDLLGNRRKYAKYRRYFGEELSPTLDLPRLVITAALTSHGVAAGSMTWKFWRDTAVKGHLPAHEVTRARQVFQAQPNGKLRVLVTHQNILRGEISRRMGLARWRQAQQALVTSGADLILCGHDHQEAAGPLDQVVVSTAGTHTSRTRGHRPSAFNVVSVDHSTITVGHHLWDRPSRNFLPGGVASFPRPTR